VSISVALRGVGLGLRAASQNLPLVKLFPLDGGRRYTWSRNHCVIHGRRDAEAVAAGVCPNITRPRIEQVKSIHTSAELHTRKRAFGLSGHGRPRNWLQAISTSASAITVSTILV
jgi:hypothetical protein